MQTAQKSMKEHLKKKKNKATTLYQNIIVGLTPWDVIVTKKFPQKPYERKISFNNK